MDIENSKTKFKLNDNIIIWLTPIYYIHRLLGCSRFIIKDKFVTTTGYLEILYSIVWIIAVTSSMVHYGKVYYSCYYEKSTVVFVGNFLTIALVYFSYISNMLYVRFFNKKTSLELLKLFQNINCDLQLDGNKCLKKFIISIFMFFLILVSVPYLIFFSIHVITVINEPIYTIFLAFGLLIVYTDIVFVGFFTMSLTLHLGYLNNLIVQYNYQSMPECRGSGIKRRRSFGKYLMNITRENANIVDPAEFFKYLSTVRDILKCFTIATELFSFTVLNVAATILIWTFLVVAILFFGTQTQLMSGVAFLTDALWPVFYFSQLTILALVSDMFIRETKNTKLLCIRVLSYVYDGPIRKSARKMIREIQMRNPTFSVYGIFTLDKRTPLQLFGIITSNIIVITQFSE